MYLPFNAHMQIHECTREFKINVRRILVVGFVQHTIIAFSVVNVMALWVNVLYNSE